MALNVARFAAKLNASGLFPGDDSSILPLVYLASYARNHFPKYAPRAEFRCTMRYADLFNQLSSAAGFHAAGGSVPADDLHEAPSSSVFLPDHTAMTSGTRTSSEIADECTRTAGTECNQHIAPPSCP